eukprot:8720728-Heterocapsa_arctica.AAC.1
MLEVCEKLGMEVKERRAPRSNLERQTQSLLDAVNWHRACTQQLAPKTEVKQGLAPKCLQLQL